MLHVRVHETISIFINPKLRKGQKSQKSSDFTKTSKTYHQTTPPKNSNQTNFHLVLSLESRSSQPFPNRSLGKFPHTPHPHLRPSMMARRCRAIPSPCSCAASAWVSAAFTTWRLRRLTPGARKDAGRTHVMSCEIFVNLEHVCRYMFVSYILIYNYIHTLCKIPFYKHRFPQKNECRYASIMLLMESRGLSNGRGSIHRWIQDNGPGPQGWRYKMTLQFLFSSRMTNLK